MLSLLALLGLLTLLFMAASTTKRAGGPSLARVTMIALGMMGLMSLALASPRFGNQLTSSEGYWPIAGRICLMLALTIALPLVRSAAAVHAPSRAGSGWILTLGAGLVAAIGGWVLGMICMFAIVWS